MYDLVTLNNLKMAVKAIEKRNEYWKGAQDGSYEMALSNSGYYDICKKIAEIESELNIVRGDN